MTYDDMVIRGLILPNGRLTPEGKCVIAAASDMLAALHAFADPGTQISAATIELARAAIAKAEGTTREPYEPPPYDRADQIAHAKQLWTMTP